MHRTVSTAIHCAERRIDLAKLVVFVLLVGFFSFQITACTRNDLPLQTASTSQLTVRTIQTVQHSTPTLTDLKKPTQKNEAIKLPEILTPNPQPPTPQPPTLTLTTIPNRTPEITICSPLDGFPREKLPKIVSAPYKPPPMGSDDRHQGVDFVYHRLAGVDIPILGVQVDSILPGIVAASLEDTFPYGNLVIIETPGSWLPENWLDELKMEAEQSLYHLYAHLQEKPLVTLGDFLSSCQAIGKVGNSGNAEAAHLHLEIRIGPGGQVFPSMFGLLFDAPEDARQNYNTWRTSGIFQHFDPMFLLMGFD